jgi:NAD(P)H-flavin reductase
LTVDKPDAEWNGPVGIIPKLYDRVDIKRGAVMIVCGPPIMYQSVIDRYAGKRVADADLFFMLERRMKCGVGKCQHCTCGKYYVCLDGPCFPYTKLKYNEEAFK